MELNYRDSEGGVHADVNDVEELPLKLEKQTTKGNQQKDKNDIF